MKVIFDQFGDFFEVATNKIVWILSMVLGVILSAIGYPKQILVFIFALIIIDIITKHYSIVVINYKDFTIKNYIRAWKERNLSSRGLKNGIGIKTILYLPILYVANQSALIPELMFGETISSVLYSLLFVIEFRSVLENFEDCGYTELKSLLKFIKKKEAQIAELDVVEENKEGEGNANQ